MPTFYSTRDSNGYMTVLTISPRTPTITERINMQLTFDYALRLENNQGNTSRGSYTLRGNISLSDNTSHTGLGVINISETWAMSPNEEAVNHWQDVVSGTITVDLSLRSFSCLISSELYVVTGRGYREFDLSTFDYIGAKCPVPMSSLNIPANIYFGSASTLTILPVDPTCKHTITWTFGSQSGTVVSLTTSTSIPFTPPLTLLNQMPSTTSGTGQLSLETYGSSGSYLGTQTYAFTASADANAKPSCSLSISDSMGYYTTYGAYIQGKSRLSVSISASPFYGSPIATYSATADGKQYNAASFTSDPITASGTVTAYVTDSRGRVSNTASQSITVLPYAAPSISLTITRCNSEGTADNDGEYMIIAMTSVIASLNSQNTATYVIKYKKNADTEWTSISGSGTSHTSSPIYCGKNEIYNFEVVVTDRILSNTYRYDMPGAFVLIDFHKDGEGITFGGVSTGNGFDCRMDASFFKGIDSANTPKLFGEELLTSVSADALTVPGTYIIASDSIAVTISDIPTHKAGVFTVRHSAGEDYDGAVGSRILQEYILSESGDTFYREGKVLQAAGVWSWGNWNSTASVVITVTPASGYTLSSNSIWSHRTTTLNIDISSSSDIPATVSGIASIAATYAPSNTLYVMGHCGTATLPSQPCLVSITNGGSISVSHGTSGVRRIIINAVYYSE